MQLVSSSSGPLFAETHFAMGDRSVAQQHEEQKQRSNQSQKVASCRPDLRGRCRCCWR